MKKRVLFWGDGYASTGFATVMNNIIGNLPKRSFDVHHLGINYRGDPHDYDWKIYPALLGGDHLGLNRIAEFATLKPDGIFILNDVWVIGRFLKKIKETWKDIPPIVVYFPVDSIDLDLDWFKDFDIVKKIVVYTKFGYNEVKKIIPNSEIEIIPHGTDTSIFYKKFETREEAKRLLFPNQDLKDSFIVLNANRNQPRKRIDLTIQAFSIFAKDKPKAVKLYLHMGIKDMGFDILKMCYRYGVDERLILSNTKKINQSVPVEKLNIIYNATDIGLNTAIGEGWSLCVSPETEIYSDGVTKKLSAINIGDKVLNKNGVFVPVLDKIERKAKTIKINPMGLPDITCTPEHPFLCVRKVGLPGYHWHRYKNVTPEWIHAKDLNKGDYIGTPIPKWNKPLPQKFDLVEWVKDDLDIEYDDEYIWMKMGYSPNNKQPSINDLQNKYKESKHTVENALKIIHNDKTMRADSRGAILAKKFKDDSIEKNSQNKIKRYIPVDDTLLNFIGWYLAEGWYNRGKFALSLHRDELYIARKFVKFFANTLEAYSIAKLDTGKRSLFDCSSTILGIFFTKLCGRGAHNKKLHKVLWESATSLAPLLLGYFDGDGHRSKTNWAVSTVSKELAWQILFILRANKIFGTFFFNEHPSTGFPNSSPSYVVGVGGYEEELFAILTKSKKTKSSRRRAKYYLHIDDYIFTPIYEVQDSIVQTVMDIKVNDTHSFTGNGVILHNTNMEHAVTGAPQIVPDHSALTELYKDTGLLVPIFQWLTNPETLTVSGYVHPVNVAEKLEELYQNKELYNELSRKSLEQWTDEKASWQYIVKNQWTPLLKSAYKT